MKVTESEMRKVTGGGINLPLVVAGGGLISFVIGIIAGYTNPVKCNN